jgi:histidinol dehydrogenase
MSIAFYTWADTDAATRKRLMRRAQENIDSVMADVPPIIADVKTRGDDALRDYALKFDGAALKTIKASEEEFDRAEKNLDGDLKAAIQKCAANVKKFHEAQMSRVEKPWMIEIEPGVWAGEQISAIESVGLYVPRGKGAFPSAMYMLCIPAVIAGVSNIAVVTPPTSSGAADDASLYTAQLCGVKNVYKVGGAQAIAALAYGTQSVPAVKKVLGPGSPYVAAAKRALSDIIDPGMPAGPSEAIILCDASADPHNTCLDLLNEAEHGTDSAVLLITHNEALMNYVRKNLPSVIESLPQPHQDICKHVFSPAGYGGLILTENLDQSLMLANEYAAEHLHLKVANPEHIAARIKHAGEILIGEMTPSTLGNYGIGVNHVLPTGGWAHTYSCTSVWDFLKRTSISKVDAQGFAALKDPVLKMTDYEGFPAHGKVLRERKI